MEFSSKKIEQLIEKYNDANTTLDEEQYLRQYFTTQQVPPHLTPYKMLFNHFKQVQKEALAQEISLPRKKINYRSIAIAAMFILAVGFYVQNRFINTKKQDETVLLAYQQTKMALQLLSNNLNTGTQKVSYLSNFEQTTNQIFKTNNNK